MSNSIEESKLKELHPLLPLIHIKAVTQETFVRLKQNNMLNCFNQFNWKEKQDLEHLYECPVYTTRQRGMNIFSFISIYVSINLCRSNLHLEIQFELFGYNNHACATNCLKADKAENYFIFIWKVIFFWVFWYVTCQYNFDSMTEELQIKNEIGEKANFPGNVIFVINTQKYKPKIA